MLIFVSYNINPDCRACMDMVSMTISREIHLTLYAGGHQR